MPERPTNTADDRLYDCNTNTRTRPVTCIMLPLFLLQLSNRPYHCKRSRRRLAGHSRQPRMIPSATDKPGTAARDLCHPFSLLHSRSRISVTNGTRQPASPFASTIGPVPRFDLFTVQLLSITDGRLIGQGPDLVRSCPYLLVNSYRPIASIGPAWKVSHHLFTPPIDRAEMWLGDHRGSSRER